MTANGNARIVVLSKVTRNAAFLAAVRKTAGQSTVGRGKALMARCQRGKRPLPLIIQNGRKDGNRFIRWKGRSLLEYRFYEGVSLEVGRVGGGEVLIKHFRKRILDPISLNAETESELVWSLHGSFKKGSLL
jgi:hypothetical protein